MTVRGWSYRFAAACAAGLLLVSSVKGGMAAPARPLPPGALSQHDGFSFSPGTCEQGQEFCAVTSPRAWTKAEIALVSTALDEINGTDVGGRVVERANRNGFRTLRRFSHGAQLKDEGRYEAEPTIAAVAHTDEGHGVRTIDVTDKFFERRTARDHFSGKPGYLLTTEILAHELVHAMDLDQRYSGTAEFRRVARLGMPATQQRIADRVNVERERLNAEGHFESSWEASRTFAVITLRGRLPSVQALDGYREAFAEFGAHLIVDPNARRRFEARLLRYWDGVLSSGD